MHVRPASVQVEAEEGTRDGLCKQRNSVDCEGPTRYGETLLDSVVSAVFRSKSVRAKAGLTWPESGIYTCDKCHAKHVGRAGVIATRCAILRGLQQRPCNCAYFVLVNQPDPME